MTDWSKYHEAMRDEPVNTMEASCYTNAGIRATLRTFAQEVHDRRDKLGHAETWEMGQDHYLCKAFAQILKERGGYHDGL